MIKCPDNSSSFSTHLNSSFVFLSLQMSFGGDDDPPGLKRFYTTAELESQKGDDAGITTTTIINQI